MINKSRADEQFLGGAEQASDAPPSDFEITVGPFAKNATVVFPSPAERKRFHTAVNAPPIPNTDEEPVGEMTQEVEEEEIIEEVKEAAFESQPIVGSDVGELDPPADVPKRVVTTAPTRGARGTTETARSVTLAIIRGLQQRKGKKPDKPEKDQDAVAMSDVEEVKMASILSAIGVPPSAVSSGSVLWRAVSEKIASVPDEAGDYLVRDDVHPVALSSWLTTKYGAEWETWDSEVVGITLQADFGVEPSPVTMNKIAALQLVARDPNQPFEDWHAFEKVCLAFDGKPPRLMLVEELTPEQMALGFSVLRVLRPTMPTYPDELKKYCAARLFEAGLVISPPELGFCDEELRTIVGLDHADLRSRSLSLYLSALKGAEPSSLEEEDPAAIQAGRLLSIHAYVLSRVDDLIRQA